MGAANFKQSRSVCFLTGQTCNSKLDFASCPITFSAAPILDGAFQAIDLCQPRPARIGVEHFTGLNGTDFKATVTFIYFLSSLEIGLDFSEAWSGIFRGKKFLNAFVQSALIFLDGKHIIKICVDNLF